MTDLPFLAPEPDPTRPERQPRTCHRHRWIVATTGETANVGTCSRCGKARDAALSRRGRNNRKRGSADELSVARLLGGEKVGPLGLPWDVIVPGWMRVQCKRLDRWPSLAQVVAWLDAIPAGTEMRGVSIADTPGPGGRTRRLLVLDLDEFASHHGRDNR